MTLTFLKGLDWSFRELSPDLDLSQWFLTIRFRLSIFGRSTPLPAPSLSLSLWIFPPTLLPQALPLTSPNLASASPPMPSPIPSPSCRVREKTWHPGTGVGGAERPPCPAHSEDMRELRRWGLAPEMVFSSWVFCSDTSYMGKQWRPALPLLKDMCV